MRQQGRDFCCHGCCTVFELLQENGLGDFYRLADRPGVQVKQATARDRFAFLDEPAVRDSLLDFSDGRLARVTFHVPAVHCVACVWLLENLFKLAEGIGQSVVDFEKKNISITFETGKMSLSGLAALLTSIGYEPTLRLDSLEKPRARSAKGSLYLKLGVAGFAFGNIMLFSICLYSGMDRFSAPTFKPLFGWASLALALPVMVYSAGDYWRAAWLGFRQRAFTIDFPIALGLVALFAQSLYEVGTGSGVGYLDSLTGLVLFLLIGRIFQDQTYQRLSFDRDYKSFFPLAVRRVETAGESSVPLSELAVGDRVRLRHGELVPADARVREGAALIDYSFVTGESEPVQRGMDEVLYAGGQQVGGGIELEIIKPVSQSYLTSLWSHETFAKTRGPDLNSVLNRFSRSFTLGVISLAFAAGAWWWSQDVSRAIRAFTSVLIVACPCALALSVPFALGTAQRLLGRLNVFTRNANVLEALARVDEIVFDKTGTLTTAGNDSVEFCGSPLTRDERGWIHSLAGRSTHPHSVRLANHLMDEPTAGVESFREVVGAGIEGEVDGRKVLLGSEAWLKLHLKAEWNPAMDRSSMADRSPVHVAVDGEHRGVFLLGNTVRDKAAGMLEELSERHELTLLSGDHDREREQFQALLGQRARLHFEQSPIDKLTAIETRQKAGRSVMMVGDGLNDAGALRQSDVGIAVVEEVGRFSPASDVIMEASTVPQLASLLRFARGSVAVVWVSIVLSLLYNVVGLTFAATGRLSPIVCAILMPLSSITVVTFACAAVNWTARRANLFGSPNKEHSS